MRAIHDRLTALEGRVAAICKAEKDAEDAAGTFRELIERLASPVQLSNLDSCLQVHSGS